VAAAAGLVIGFERELRAHTAGLRTHTLVAVGAALFTVAGAYGFSDLPRAPTVDPARLAAQVASGIGFLGAGAIMRQGFGVRGLTTAATLWLSAALGVTAGAGAYAAVAITTGVVVVVLVVMRLATPMMRRLSWASNILEIQYERGHGTLGPVLRAIADANIKVEGIEVTDDDDNLRPGLRRALITVTAADSGALPAVAEALRDRNEVRTVRITTDG
jgi:putative Mg2+ transporter-C (MgtC) family protein